LGAPVKLERRHGRRPDSTLEHPRFRAGYDFLLLRERCGEIPPDLGQWWTEYQIADAQTQRELIKAVADSGEDSPKRRPRRRRRSDVSED